jgi:hypothetical protein
VSPSEHVDWPTSDAGALPITITSGAAGQPSASGAAGDTLGGSAGTSVPSASGPAGAAGAGGAAGKNGAAGASGGQSGGAGAGHDAGALDTGTTSTPGGARDAGGADASSFAATWTDIYNKMLNNTSYASNCTGGGCHNRGTQKGLDLSTQAKGYTTIKAKLVAGNPSASSVVSQLSSGKMPQARPQMPAADLNVIKAWIMGGAPNN